MKEYYGASCIDLSASGLQMRVMDMELMEALRVGMNMTLKLCLPGYPEAPSVTAKVIRTKRNEDNLVVGVQFWRFFGDAQAAISQYVKACSMREEGTGTDSTGVQSAVVQSASLEHLRSAFLTFKNALQAIRTPENAQELGQLVARLEIIIKDHTTF